MKAEQKNILPTVKTFILKFSMGVCGILAEIPKKNEEPENKKLRGRKYV